MYSKLIFDRISYLKEDEIATTDKNLLNLLSFGKIEKLYCNNRRTINGKKTRLHDRFERDEISPGTQIQKYSQLAIDFSLPIKARRCNVGGKSDGRDEM